MPIKHSFTPSELINSTNRTVMTKVAKLFESNPQCEGLILEDCGSWLEQRDWTDRSGFYMTLRLAPLDKHRDEVQNAGRNIFGKFIDMFPRRNTNGTSYDGYNGLEDGEKVTVFVHTDTTSIGD